MKGAESNSVNVSELVLKQHESASWSAPRSRFVPLRGACGMKGLNLASGGWGWGGGEGGGGFSCVKPQNNVTFKQQPCGDYPYIENASAGALKGNLSPSLLFVTFERASSRRHMKTTHGRSRTRFSAVSAMKPTEAD